MTRKTSNPTRLTIGISFLLLVLGGAAPFGLSEAAGLALKRGDRIAITGDSITEQKRYSKFMETYLLACVPQLDLKVIQLGWSGERAPGFQRRMENDLMFWKPDVVTTAYGMNDGRYRKYEDSIGKTYADAMQDIVSRLTEAGATVIVGSPGVVDSYSYDQRRPGAPATAAVYNENLATLGDIARNIASENNALFADVNGTMSEAMQRAKAEHGEEYHVAGRDGVHPHANGHLLMAYAFLRAMGLDGQIGRVEMEWGAEATGSDGHNVLSSDGGTIELESTRYPFCFTGDSDDPGGTVSILSSIPFQQDLNRFELSVRSLPTPRATIVWGEESKSFASEQRIAGINLAAEFLQNPFSEPFAGVLEEVAQKQRFETFMIQYSINRFPSLRDNLSGDTEVDAALDTLHRKLTERQQLLHTSARSAIKPVRHTIQIIPEG